MESLIILLSIILLSLTSFLNFFFLIFKKEKIEKIIPYLIYFSVGNFLGISFFHLLPEIAEEKEINEFSHYILFGIILFFLIGKIIDWHHHHQINNKCSSCPLKKESGSLSKKIIVSNSTHNFLDGIIIASSFLINLKTGLIVSLFILIHKIPKEMSVFSVLLFDKNEIKKSIFINFFSNIFLIFGFISFLFIEKINNLEIILMSISIGGLIFISLSDLLPSVKRKNEIWDLFFLFLGLIITFLSSKII